MNKKLISGLTILTEKKLRRVAFALVTTLLIGAPVYAEKILVFCSEASPEGFNPQLYTVATTLDASAVPLFNRLVAFKLGTAELMPSLAENWAVSKNDKEYTFKLRKDVKFHPTKNFTPTRHFNADDVLFSYNRMANPNHPFAKTLPGQTYSYFEDMGMKNIVDRVEKIDDYTVRFILKQPNAAFVANMAMPFMSILSAEQAEKMKIAGTVEQIDLNPSGTGPFELVSYDKDATIRYKAFDQYWDGRPKIDKLIFAITPDASVRYAKLTKNECQVAALPKPADVELMLKDPNINVIKQTGLNIGYVAFNTEKKPFDNKLVRQALNYATNKKAIMKAVYLGTGTLATSLIPPSMWSYNSAIKAYDYDPDKAKKLLAQAGVKSGTEFDLWYLPVSRPYNPDGKRMAEMIQADWEKVGIKVKLVTYEWGEYRKRSKAGEHIIAMYGWSSDNGDPDNFFQPLLGCDAVKGGGNIARWCNKEYEMMTNKAVTITDIRERTKLYKKAQEIFHEEAPWTPIAHALRFDPIRKNVKGYLMDPLAGHHHFEKTDLVRAE